LATPDRPQAPDGHEELGTTAPLQDLQTDEQRHVLCTVTQVRKCGLDSILSLPQLVVYGYQSAGKSRVQEGITGTPFPSHDRVCSNYVTEIVLHHNPDVPE